MTRTLWRSTSVMVVGSNWNEDMRDLDVGLCGVLKLMQVLKLAGLRLTRYELQLSADCALVWGLRSTGLDV